MPIRLIVKALKRSKSDTLTIQEIDELKGEVEPLIELLDDCINAHLELLERKESDHKEEKEEWETEAEGTHTMWEQCLDIWRSQLGAF